jgi:hypothetical protein
MFALVNILAARFVEEKGANHALIDAHLQLKPVVACEGIISAAGEATP